LRNAKINAVDRALVAKILAEAPNHQIGHQRVFHAFEIAAVTR